MAVVGITFASVRFSSLSILSASGVKKVRTLVWSIGLRCVRVMCFESLGDFNLALLDPSAGVPVELAVADVVARKWWIHDHEVEGLCDFLRELPAFLSRPPRLDLFLRSGAAKLKRDLSLTLVLQ